MIYQEWLKRAAAHHNGVSAGAYFRMAYVEWAEIRAEYLTHHAMNGAPRPVGGVQ